VTSEKRLDALCEMLHPVIGRNLIGVCVIESQFDHVTGHVLVESQIAKEGIASTGRRRPGL